jgi:hypothetical protein
MLPSAAVAEAYATAAAAFIIFLIRKQMIFQREGVG